MAKKFYIDTLGCPKNVNDSEYAAGVLLGDDYTEVDSPEDADFVIVNTCAFIEDAKKESIDRIFEMVDRKKPGAKLVVSGCLAQRYGEELAKELPEASCFIGVEQYSNIASILNEIENKQRDDNPDYSNDKGVNVTNNNNTSDRVFIQSCNLDYLEKTVRRYKETPYTSTIKIAEGCNNRCSYCAIPYIRGNYRSKKMEDIIQEAIELAEAGCKELILIAQDVAYYGKDMYGKYMLSNLLRELVKIDGIRWIRLMYCYDDRITDDLIDVIATEEKICKYIDIPIQHGSDKVLKEMHRNSTNESIRNVIKKLRDRIPGICIRTTMIVGFPGETDEDFDELVRLVDDMEFNRMGAFKYSKEEGTPAGRREDQISEEIKEYRLDALMRRQMDISLNNNKKLIGTIQDVIIDSLEGKETIYGRNATSYMGRTSFDAPEIDNGVIFTALDDDCGELKVGDMVKVKVLDAFDYDLVGEIWTEE